MFSSSLLPQSRPEQDLNAYLALRNNFRLSKRKRIRDPGHESISEQWINDWSSLAYTMHVLLVHIMTVSKRLLAPTYSSVSLPFNGHHRLFLAESKRLGCMRDQWVPSNAEVNNQWSYTSSIPYAFLACARTVLRFGSIELCTNLPKFRKNFPPNFVARLTIILQFPCSVGRINSGKSTLMVSARLFAFSVVQPLKGLRITWS